eukprot:jgi/Picre1/27259/NNA_000228.t1
MPCRKHHTAVIDMTDDAEIVDQHRKSSCEANDFADSELDEYIRTDDEVALGRRCHRAPANAFPVLKIIQQSQSIHGLKHSEYTRYRQYCARRLHRIYKGMKFLHGRGRYQKKTLTADMIHDERLLHIPLVSAERAWAITKAAVHAKEMASIVSQRDGTGYCSVSFSEIESLLSELFKVSDYDQRVSIRHLLDQVEPSARFCEYKLGGKSVPMHVEGSGTLASKLQELAAENAAAKDSGAVSEIEWNGVTYPVREERCKVKVVTAMQLASALEESTAAFLDKSDKEQDDSKCGQVCLPARHNVGGTANGAQALEMAAHGLEQEWTIRRNSLLATVIQSRLERALKRRLVPSKLKEKSEKPARPEELVRIYETLIANVTTLNDLAAESGGAQGEVLMDECAAQIAQFQAFRCYYIAHKYLGDSMFAEAYALFERTQKRCATAVDQIDECVNVDDARRNVWAMYRLNQKAFQLVCVAEYRGIDLQQAQTASHAVGSVSLREGGPSSSRKDADTMVDQLESWTSFAGDGHGPGKISRIPPAIPYLPVRPIILDAALMGIEPPSLDHRVVKQPTSQAVLFLVYSDGLK